MAARFINPTLVLGPPSASARSMYSSGCGAGFQPPAFAAQIDTAHIIVGAPADTVVGALTFAPDGSTLALQDDANGHFVIDDDGNLAIADPIFFGDGTSFNVTLRVSYGGLFRDIVVPITIDQYTLSLSGSHSVAHTASVGDTVGNASSVPAEPVGSAYQLGAGSTGNFVFDTPHLKVQATNTAGAKSSHIQLVDGSLNVLGQVIVAITVT